MLSREGMRASTALGINLAIRSRRVVISASETRRSPTIEACAPKISASGTLMAMSTRVEIVRPATGMVAQLCVLRSERPRLLMRLSVSTSIAPDPLICANLSASPSRINSTARNRPASPLARRNMTIPPRRSSADARLIFM